MIGGKTKETEAFWEASRKQHNLDAEDYHCTTLFDPECIDLSVPTLDLSDQPKLICRGQKQGTAHMKLDFEMNAVARRKTGDFWVLLDPERLKPFALVKVTDVYEKPFDEVPESFSVQEGEGDMSLQFWRDAHYDYFIRVCEKLGIDWDSKHVVVCESFELVEPNI